jgi:hypothetical protein
VFDDVLFRGDTITLDLLNGYKTILEIGNEKYFHVSDTIILKFCTMDRTTYEFWRAVSEETLTSANQFSSTYSSIKGNINDGIGIWAGYGVTYDTVWYGK